MTKENSTKLNESPESDPPGEVEREEISEVRQAFMGHDFLRRNLLVLLSPAIQPVTRRVN